MWNARFRFYGQYDTNVTVLPDHTATSTGGTPATVADATALRRKAAGIGGEAELRLTPLRGITELSFAGGVSFLGHLNGRKDTPVGTDGLIRQGSKEFDYGTVDLQGRLAFLRERWTSALELDGTMVFIDDYAQRYLTERDVFGVDELTPSRPLKRCGLAVMLWVVPVTSVASSLLVTVAASRVG